MRIDNWNGILIPWVYFGVLVYVFHGQSYWVEKTFVHTLRMFLFLSAIAVLHSLGQRRMFVFFFHCMLHCNGTLEFLFFMFCDARESILLKDWWLKAVGAISLELWKFTLKVFWSLGLDLRYMWWDGVNVK